MNLHLEPPGFLGTGASLLADLSLLAYILLIIPSLVAGYVFARRGQHRPQHKWIMTGITVFNWVLILLLMIAAYRFDVVDGIASQPGNIRYLLPTIHGLLGLPAQLLATYVVYRMLREDAQVAAARKRGEANLSRYWFRQARWTMQVVFWLWLATALLGIGTYLVRYNVVGGGAIGGDMPAPVATEEVDDPAATPDLTPEPDDPTATPEPAG
jgi:uncharacterized membrane protein YozB (DUF420 family)